MRSARNPADMSPPPPPSTSGRFHTPVIVHARNVSERGLLYLFACQIVSYRRLLSQVFVAVFISDVFRVLTKSIHF